MIFTPQTVAVQTHEMTEEERRATVIWQLREWGMHPDWVLWYITNQHLAWTERAIKAHADRHGENAADALGHYFKKPRKEQT